MSFWENNKITHDVVVIVGIEWFNITTNHLISLKKTVNIDDQLNSWNVHYNTKTFHIRFQDVRILMHVKAFRDHCECILHSTSFRGSLWWIIEDYTIFVSIVRILKHFQSILSEFHGINIRQLSNKMVFLCNRKTFPFRHPFVYCQNKFNVMGQIFL